MKKMTKRRQNLTMQQLELVLKLLYKNYPNLLKKIHFRKGQYETICGNISEAIGEYLGELGLEIRNIHGKYKGRGSEFSGGSKGTWHCWIELWLNIKTEYSSKAIDVIIDGAYAQFFPFKLTPIFVRDRVRLAVFINDKIARRWYKGIIREYPKIQVNPKLSKKLK